jgi:hypothetical protein
MNPNLANFLSFFKPDNKGVHQLVSQNIPWRNYRILDLGNRHRRASNNDAYYNDWV